MERESGRRNQAIPIVIFGGIVIVAILVFGTLWTGRTAQRDANDAVRSVSSLYLDELAGRREQVVENNLKGNIDIINIAIDLMAPEDLSDQASLEAYLTQMKSLFNRKCFAVVTEDGTVYASQEAQIDPGQQHLEYAAATEPRIFVKNPSDPNKVVTVVAPVKGVMFQGKQIVSAFVEIDMDVMLEGVSMTSQDSEATFCNIYTSDGIALSNTVLGGLAVEDNLLEALSHADFAQGSSYEQVVADFKEGRQGRASFTYNGIQETLSYVPIEDTDWLLTYLIRESVISERISSLSDGIIFRSLVQSILAALVLGAVFFFVIAQMRKNTQLTIEKEASEAANKAKHQEMEQRLALQEQLLEQKAEQEQQEKMLSSLASDYRSVYYLQLDQNSGICYQARTDLDGLKAGDEFEYLQTMTAYGNQYVLEPYREEFLSFVQPDAIREGLSESRVISFRYMVNIGGKESYEAVRFATVRRDDERDDQEIRNVGACFADVDAETRKDLVQQQALSDALEVAEQASKAKTAFLSNMSHEIRTPMNAIIGLNNIALNEPDVPEKLQEYLLKTGASAQHLLGIINDILDMSRIESGRMILKDEEFSFAKNLEQVNTIISGQCAEKGLDYDCRTIGKVDDYFVGDGMKLKQVMINILGNAVKFTPRGGSVTFLIKETRRYKGKVTLEFIVSDTGIGMSEEFLPHIFDAFSQEDSSSTSRYGSTGLGLPITKSIVELMNGHIDVESKKGEGTTFTATVTLGESDHKAGETMDGEIDPGSLNVLVIDDDQIELEHAKIVLNQVGIGCETASSGSEGFEMVKTRHARREDYDLLIVDWKMPEMDGVETVRKIRSVVGYDMPIIILTAYNWDDIVDEAQGAGVDTFVPKPLFAGSVMDEFQEVFKRKGRALTPGLAELKGRRVLLAEDMVINAEIMVMVLGMREVDVEVAENGRIAVDKYLEHPAGYYDAILMDMRMPEMDGLEATRAIRASDHEDAKTIPIIALTANAFDEDVQRSLQAGLNAHLSKPVEPDTLFETLQSLIEP